jgi:hypothetical protein
LSFAIADRRPLHMPRLLRLLLVLASLWFAAGAGAQVQRAFPATALRGALVIVDPPNATLNGAPARLAPGARIRNAQNALQLSASLVGARLLVHYTLDPLGLILDVWILTPDEAAKRPWPTTPQEAAQWSFDPVAQTWSQP